MQDKTVVKILHHLEMVGFIKANGTQCRFVSLTIKTPVVKLRAKNPFHPIKKGKVVGEPQLFKISRKTGLLNANYNTSVRRRLADKLNVELKEVEYTGGDVWYEHLRTPEGKPLPIVQHATESMREQTGYSLQFFPLKTLATAYVNHQGEAVDVETIKPYMLKESERPDYKPAVIAPKMANIVELRASGVIMQSEDIEEAETLFATP